MSSLSEYRRIAFTNGTLNLDPWSGIIGPRLILVSSYKYTVGMANIGLGYCSIMNIDVDCDDRVIKAITAQS